MSGSGFRWLVAMPVAGSHELLDLTHMTQSAGQGWPPKVRLCAPGCPADYLAKLMRRR